MSRRTLMPLIRCYECGSEISSLAKVCPACGAPAKRNTAGRSNEPPPIPLSQNTMPSEATSAKQQYWFGYLYAAFWAFVTYACATHTFATWSVFINQPLPTEIGERSKVITLLVIWPVATFFFAWVTYRLLIRRVSYTMILFLVALHTLNVISEGVIPYKVLLWLFLTVIVVTKFRPRELHKQRITTKQPSS